MLTSTLLLTLSLILSLVQAEVFTNFQCSEYFYKRNVPVLGVAVPVVPICQRYKNRYHFATLYDTMDRIPVYSAYIFQGSDGTPRPTTWFLEPQLVDRNWGPNMTFKGDLMKAHPGVFLGDYQALDDDYKGSGLDRGHLNPFFHNKDDSAIATFTLTNAVPQYPKLNSGKWRALEARLSDVFKKCAKTYVVVGAIPSGKKINNRVDVPAYLWVAYCCVDNNEKPKLSGAAVAKNTNENKLEEFCLGELVKFLKLHYQSVGNMFYNNCKYE